MEATAVKPYRFVVLLPMAVLSALCLIGQIVGAVYWTATGHLWAAVASLFIPLFGAVSLVAETIAG